MDMQYLLVTMTRVLENCGLSERETYGQVPPRNDIILFPLHAAGSLLVRPFVCGRGRVHLLSFVPSGQYQFYNTCTSCCFIRRWQNSSLKTITVTKFIQMPVWLIMLTSVLSFLGIALALFFLGFNLRYRKKRLVLKAIKITFMLWYHGVYTVVLKLIQYSSSWNKEDLSNTCDHSLHKSLAFRLSRMPFSHWLRLLFCCR